MINKHYIWKIGVVEELKAKLHLECSLCGEVVKFGALAVFYVYFHLKRGDT